MKIQNKKIPPAQIADNLFWVGVSSDSPAHLVETTDGLVLIDTASDYNRDVLISNIESLGFDIRDIRHIIHSHGHFDHIGATTKIVSVSGAKTYIGRRDRDAVAGVNKRLWCTRQLPENADEFYFEPDVLLDDGDVLKVGKTEFRFVATPGHTEGVMSIFWNVSYNGKEYLCGMFGGAGTAALSDAYLERDGLPVSLREDYVNSVDKIIDEPVEFHVGNHPGNNRHTDKVDRVGKSSNPFIKENSWEEFLLKSRNSVVNEYDIGGAAISHTLDAIIESKAIVIIRGILGETLVNTVRALRAGGIKCCEITYDATGATPDSVIAENIAALVREFPDMHIGAGTVLKKDQVIKTARAGGKFIISPDTNADIIAITKSIGLLSIPGAFTPTESALAARMGADFVKLFPAGRLGPGYLKDISAPLSHVRFLAVGGVDAENVKEYLNAGAVGVGVASSILNKKFIAEGKFDEITRLAKEYLAAMNN